MTDNSNNPTHSAQDDEPAPSDHALYCIICGKPFPAQELHHHELSCTGKFAPSTVRANPAPPQSTATQPEGAQGQEPEPAPSKLSAQKKGLDNALIDNGIDKTNPIKRDMMVGRAIALGITERDLRTIIKDKLSNTNRPELARAAICNLLLNKPTELRQIVEDLKAARERQRERNQKDTGRGTLSAEEAEMQYQRLMERCHFMVDEDDIDRAHRIHGLMADNWEIKDVAEHMELTMKEVIRLWQMAEDAMCLRPTQPIRRHGETDTQKSIRKFMDKLGRNNDA